MNGSVRIRFIRVEEINQIVWTQKELRSNGHLIYVKANQDSKSIQERITTIFSETLAYCWALGCKPSAYSTEFAPLTTLHDPVSDSAINFSQSPFFICPLFILIAYSYVSMIFCLDSPDATSYPRIAQFITSWFLLYQHGVDLYKYQTQG